MMVPRAFIFSSASPQRTTRQGEKDQAVPSTPRRRGSQLQQDGSQLQLPSKSPTDPPSVMHTSPVVIPPKRASRRTPVTPGTGNRSRNTINSSGTLRRSSSIDVGDGKMSASVATLLEVTAIPLPRRSWTVRSSRKLPPGNHVEDFSKLLMEGIKPREEHKSMIDGAGNATLDVLLSPPDGDNEKFMFGSDLEPEIPLSIRSMSTDSMPSLDHELDSYTPFSLPATPPTASQRSPMERRLRQLSPAEECASDHPLLETETTDSFDQWLAASDTVSPRSAMSTRKFPRLGSTFKSNLTASLRAIKSAAQTVSNFATPSVQPEDFLTRSLFSITPELTDDRRPLPMADPPSPALRRYLNPINGSPAEMHVYHEHPHDPTNTPHDCPVSIQMQTYNRSGRNGSKKSGFSVVTSDDGDSPFDPEIPPMARQREPRENSDFLRMVVLEMNMRRSGKLRDDIPTRASIWLPPRKVNPSRLSPNLYGDDKNAVPQRWIGVCVGGM